MASQYETIQEIINMLRAGNRDFQTMFKMLVDSGMDKETADKMLDRLLAQVEEE